MSRVYAEAIANYEAALTHMVTDAVQDAWDTAAANSNTPLERTMAERIARYAIEAHREFATENAGIDQIAMESVP